MHISAFPPTAARTTLAVETYVFIQRSACIRWGRRKDCNVIRAMSGIRDSLKWNVATNGHLQPFEIAQERVKVFGECLGIARAAAVPLLECLPIIQSQSARLRALLARLSVVANQINRKNSA